MDQLIDLIKQHPEQISAWAAVCALVVSFVAIYLAAYTAWLQRRHNFKLVTPIADFRKSDYEDQLEVTLREQWNRSTPCEAIHGLGRKRWKRRE